VAPDDGRYSKDTGCEGVDKVAAKRNDLVVDTVHQRLNDEKGEEEEDFEKIGEQIGNLPRMGHRLKA
jgi:hypothetical protein